MKNIIYIFEIYCTPFLYSITIFNIHRKSVNWNIKDSQNLLCTGIIVMTHMTNVGEQDILRGIERRREDNNAQKMVRKNVMMPPTDAEMMNRIRKKYSTCAIKIINHAASLNSK